MRSRPVLTALVALVSMLAAAGCPKTTGSGAPKPTPTPSAWRPLPKAQPVGDAKVCVSNDDCGADSGRVCSTPEEQSWGRCGDQPGKPNCGPGWLGDECGHCFLSCASYENCPKGMVCGKGGYCVSQSRCMAVQVMPH